MRALRADAKLFVPGVGSVTPERARARGGRGGSEREMDDRSNGSARGERVDARASDGSPSGLALSSSEESDAVWARELGREEVAVALEAEMEAEAEADADGTRAPLLGNGSMREDETYGSGNASPRVDREVSAPLIGREGGRGTSYGAAEAELDAGADAASELDAEATVEERTLDVSEDAVQSAAGAPLLASPAGLAEYGAGEAAPSPNAWSDARVPLLPVVKESTYGAASPIRKSTRVGNARRVKELTAPPPIEVETREMEEDALERARARVDQAAQTPLLAKPSSGGNPVNYGTIDETVRLDDLRGAVMRNTAPYEIFENEEREQASEDDEELLQYSDNEDVDDERVGALDDPPAPSAPPLEGMDFASGRAIVDDLCCIVWTVARERLDLLQPLFRVHGTNGIGRITLDHLRQIMEKLEPQRATPRALDRLEAMLCACGYTEDVALSEFVHATHAGTLAATRLTTASGAHEASILCRYLDELMTRTPASAQTALMLGGRRHKAWLDLPRLLAKNLEPDQLCLLIAVLDNADSLTSSGRFVDFTAYQSWLRRAANALHSAPLPRPPLEVAPSAPAIPVPNAEEIAERRARRERLVRLWEERDERRRAASSA